MPRAMSGHAMKEVLDAQFRAEGRTELAQSRLDFLPMRAAPALPMARGRHLHSRRG